MFNHHRTWMVPGLCGLAMAFAGGQAFAAGFQLKEQSAAGLGTAYAGSTARADDASTIFFNPAGMTRLNGTQITTGAAYIAPQSDFSGSGVTSTGASTGSLSGGDAGRNALLPSFYGMYSLSDDFKVGLSVNTPWGLTTKYESDWAGRYQAIKSDLRTIDVVPSVAYRVNDTLSVGGGIIFQRIEAELTNAVYNMGLSAVDGMGKVEGEDWGYGVNLGAMLEFSPTSRVGINYRSRIQHELEGSISYNNVAAAIATAGNMHDDSATAKVTIPDVVSIGGYHELSPEWALVGEVSWTNWSLFDHLTIDSATGRDTTTDEKWKDSWFFSAGTIYKPTDKWTLRGGLAYDSSPVSDSHRTARIPDEDRIWVATGASYQLTDAVQLDAGYTHIFVNSASINETTSQGTLSGSYDNSIDIITIGSTVRF
jgi:long-chain fatty acid transport protein